MTEPVTCPACTRKYSRRMAFCPFCNATHAGETRPQPTPDEVSLAVTRALETGKKESGTQITPEQLRIVGAATAVLAAAAFWAGSHYDVLKPGGDDAGFNWYWFLWAPVAFFFVWLRWQFWGWSFRRDALGPPDPMLVIRIIVTLCLVAVPVVLAGYLVYVVGGAWTAGVAVRLECKVLRRDGARAYLSCSPPQGWQVGGVVHGVPLAHLGHGEFTLPGRRSLADRWYVDVTDARLLMRHPPTDSPGAAPTDEPARPSFPKRKPLPARSTARPRSRPGVPGPGGNLCVQMDDRGQEVAVPCPR
jgi:hypothetical protein